MAFVRIFSPIGVALVVAVTLNLVIGSDVTGLDNTLECVARVLTLVLFVAALKLIPICGFLEKQMEQK